MAKQPKKTGRKGKKPKKPTYEEEMESRYGYGTEKRSKKSVTLKRQKKQPEGIKCLWEKHLPKSARRVCPYTEEQKDSINIGAPFTGTTCRFCQEERKISALERIDFELEDIEMHLSTGSTMVDILDMNIAGTSLDEVLTESLKKVLPEIGSILYRSATEIVKNATPNPGAEQKLNAAVKKLKKLKEVDLGKSKTHRASKK